MTTHIYGFMVLCMKTTVEIEDDLLIDAKKQAAEQRIPLRKIIEDGLRSQLYQQKAIPLRTNAPISIEWITVGGGVDPARRI